MTVKFLASEPESVTIDMPPKRFGEPPIRVDGDLLLLCQTQHGARLIRVVNPRIDADVILVEYPENCEGYGI